jgi:phosphatidylinositol-3-phosphatase
MSSPRRCHECGSALADDQRYCLTCGARAGERSPHLSKLLETVGADAAAERAPIARQEPPGPPPASAGFSSLRLPSPLVSALLVAVFVGFGALLGGASSSHARLSASAGSLHVVVPGSSETAGAGSTSSASEPPPAEEETTPQAPSSAEEETTQSSEPSATNSGEKKSHKKTKKTGSGKAKPPTLREIEHVFLVVLSNEPYAGDFGPESTDKYLSGKLEKKGELLLRYDAIAHAQLPNGIALLSGQGPTAQTAANCPTFAALAPTGVGSDEQVLGEGCVYPSSVETLPGQLAAKRLTWRAYIQGIDEPGAAAGACAHPELGAQSTVQGTYAAYRNPFVFFESLTASPSCQSEDVGLSSLKGDLAGAASHAPSLAYIAPDLCHDADPTPCASGAVAGAADAAGTLESVVGEIMASAAYKHDGLIVITADEAPASGELEDSSSCCGQPASYPNYDAPGRGKGGGAVGALLLSPLIKAGSISQEPYDHYSLLRTIEDIFGVAHIGYAALPAVKSFSAGLLNGG